MNNNVIAYLRKRMRVSMGKYILMQVHSLRIRMRLISMPNIDGEADTGIA